MVPPDVRNAPPSFVLPNSAVPEQLHHLQDGQSSQEPASSAQRDNAYATSPAAPLVYDPTLTSPADADELFPTENPTGLQGWRSPVDYSFDEFLSQDGWIFDTVGSPSDVLAGESLATAAAGVLLADDPNGDPEMPVVVTASNGNLGGDFSSSSQDDLDAGGPVMPPGGTVNPQLLGGRPAPR